MIVHPTRLQDVLLLEPKIFGDARGFFLESFNRERYREAGIQDDFVQDNLSMSSKGVLRGLHFQKPHTQAKLVSVLEGEVYDVAVDLRQSSSTFKQWEGYVLNGEKKRQLYIPAGFAHGFVVLSEKALFQYKCSDFYRPEAEQTILWNDPELAIDWPLKDEPRLSEKDRKGIPLSRLDSRQLFT